MEVLSYNDIDNFPSLGCSSWRRVFIKKRMEINVGMHKFFEDGVIYSSMIPKYSLINLYIWRHHIRLSIAAKSDSLKKNTSFTYRFIFNNECMIKQTFTIIFRYYPKYPFIFYVLRVCVLQEHV